MKEEKILQVLKKHGPLTSSQIAKITGYPRTTVYDKLSKLQLKGKVKKKPEKRNKKGRPKIYWEIT